ncbi:MAG TPA: pilus assembly protein N-terminal domain-containing protein [Polyangiaceae bacterium]|nr:pilus assembly protein N-terminal domain-containing protein [Polyangiaceae bacterium]
MCFRQLTALLLGVCVLAAVDRAGAQRRKDKEEAPEAPRAEEGELPVSKEEVRELNLAVGESQTISAANVESYSEGGRDIARVRLTPDGGRFVVVGEKPGATTLLLIMKDKAQVKYSINVFARDMRRVETELLQLLEGTPGIRVRRVGARMFIEGGVSSEAEFKRINQIAALFPGQVESLVVQGGVAAARQINIRVDFFFVQYDRSGNYQFGVSWPGRVGGAGVLQGSANYDLLAGAVTSAQASVVDQPLPGLDMAARNGWAKVLKHSTVITSNGSEATFSSGGEQNYVVSSGLAAALTPIRFGTDVTVLPRYDPALGELDVKVGAEVMDLTPPVAAGTDLPGRNVSKLSTLVSLKLGQSIVLSGIRTRAQRHTTGGIPLLSEIPVLGVLFGSAGDAKEEVEGAIFIVPSVIESIPKGAQEIIDEALAQYGDFSGDMDDVNAWEKNPARAPGVRTRPLQERAPGAAPR